MVETKEQRRERLKKLVMLPKMSFRGLLLVAAGVIGVAAIWIVATGPGVPQKVMFAGKSVEIWSLQAYARDAKSEAVLRELGSRAVPNLIWQLRLKDSWLRKELWGRKPRLPKGLQYVIQRDVSAPRLDLATKREAAAFALGVIGPDAKTAVPVLVAALSDKEGTVCWKAAKSLGQIGPDSVARLRAALKESDAQVRWTAAYALGEMGSAAALALPELLQCTSDPNEQVRHSSVYSLGQLKGAAFLSLTEAARGGNECQKNAALGVLTEFDRVNRESVADVLIQLAHDPMPATRMRAITAIGELRPGLPLTRKAVIDSLNDPDREVRLRAIGVLSAMGKRGRPATQSLAALAQGPDENLRSAAKEALERIQGAAAHQ